MADVYYDPYDVDINQDPYPVYRRMREEAPLYVNERYGFHALTRYDDVEQGLKSWSSFLSSKGAIIELIQAGIDIPPGTLIFEDPPIHDIHRGLLSRVFTPKKMLALEPQIRAYCAQSLDPLVGEDGFDFIADLGAQMPMKVIGMLLGIPEEDQASVRDHADANLRTKPGERMEVGDSLDLGQERFAEYIEWRSQHPSDDLMTDLLTAEFEDETGTVRCLTRDEVLTYITVVAGAGNETTTRLIGWTGKVLSDHPDQRKQLVEDRSLVPNAIEEILRYESPAPHVARFVAKDLEYYGTTVPEGSIMLFLNGSANRDDRRFPDGDTFDIHRDMKGHITFGFGIHFCLGAALARLEGRIALDEVLSRFPEWTVDTDKASLSPTSTVRGWQSLPVTVP